MCDATSTAQKSIHIYQCKWKSNFCYLSGLHMIKLDSRMCCVIYLQHEHLFLYSGPDSQARLILSPRALGLVSFLRNSNLIVGPEQRAEKQLKADRLLHTAVTVSEGDHNNNVWESLRPEVIKERAYFSLFPCLPSRSVLISL